MEKFLDKIKQSIEVLRYRDGEAAIMVDVAIQNIICFYDEARKELDNETK